MQSVVYRGCMPAKPANCDANRVNSRQALHAPMMSLGPLFAKRAPAPAWATAGFITPPVSRAMCAKKPLETAVSDGRSRATGDLRSRRGKFY